MSGETAAMTATSLRAPSAAEGEFRVGGAMNKAITVLSHNLLPFSIVAGVAALPQVLLFGGQDNPMLTTEDFAWLCAALGLWVVLGALSQAVVLHSAFEDMRGRRVDLLASFRQAWPRLLPVFAVGLCVFLFAGLACLALVVPGMILSSMWYVAAPACVVERTGPWKSLRRSAALTKGYRWKMFGMMIVVWIIGGIGTGVVAAAEAASGATIGMVVNLVWSAVTDAYAAVLVVVTYHDLRVVKEGIDTDQIAAVFE